MTARQVTAEQRLAQQLDAARQHQEGLERSEAQLRAFVRHAPVSMAMLDRQMTYLAASDRWINDFAPGEAIVGRNHYEVHPDLPAWWRDVHDRGLAGETVKNDEELWVKAGGVKQWVRWAVLPWRDEAGSVGGIIITSEDITVRKTVEEQLRESSQKYAALFKESPFALALTRRSDGALVDVNDAFLELFEYERGEVLGRSLVALGIIEPAGQTEVAAELAARGLVRNFEHTRASKSGARRALSLNLDFIDIGGERHLLVTIRDLTELRLAEEAARRYEEVKQLDALKNAFFANVSHELRTPLTLILGPVEDALAQRDRALSGAELEAVHRGAVRLTRLVNSLLEYSRLTAGKAQVAFAPTDLAQLTTDLASSFRSLVERAGLSLVVDCPPLPASVPVDRSHWEQIVLNLLSNAFKFTFEGQIKVALRWLHDHVELEVTDTGTGIPATQLGHVFERFHRVPGARSRSYEGTGIGLSLVSELARLHGGTVRVASTEHQGSTFTVSIPTRQDAGAQTLPAMSQRDVPARLDVKSDGGAAAPYVLEAAQWLSREAAAGSANDMSDADRAGDASTTERRSILIADDNADMRAYLARLLGGRYHVELATDGRAALAAARAHAPDLVLSDVMMPGLDGFGLLRELRAAPATSTVPVILLSARAGEEAVLEGLETGADDYLVKPFSARELLTRVNTHLEMARVRKDSAAVADHRAWLEAVLDLAPLPLVLLEPASGRVTFANAAATVLADGPLERAVPHEAIERAARGEHMDGAELVWRAPRGPRAVLAFSQTLPAAHNHPATVVGAFLDVSSLKQTEADLKAAVRARDEFLAVAAHELRTPLATLVLQLAAARDHFDAPDLEAARDKLLRCVDKANTSARRLTKLVDGLLDVSRVATGQLPLSPEPLDLSELARDVAERFADAAREANCDLRLRLPHRAAGAWDRLRLEQVLSNLLSNAIKYGRDHPVEVHLEAEAQRVRLHVRDQGIGIPAEDLERIFGRFERAVTIRHYGGLGLGLYITRQIVEAHRGTIHATSTPGAGTTFTVELPR